MERVLLHKVPGSVPRLERVTDRSVVFCLCVEEPPASKRAIKNPVGIVRGGCELCDGTGLVTDELAAMFVGGLLELEEAGTA